MAAAVCGHVVALVVIVCQAAPMMVEQGDLSCGLVMTIMTWWRAGGRALSHVDLFFQFTLSHTLSRYLSQHDERIYPMDRRFEEIST